MTAPDLPIPDRPLGHRIDWASALAEHGRWLRAVVLARLGERQAGEEGMQEVSLAAVAQRAPLSEPDKLASWLYQLAVRKALRYRRQRGRQHRLLDRYAQRVRDGSDGPSSSDPLGWLLTEERHQLVRRALERLPGPDAEILLLKYTENLSYRELAERLGLSEAAVTTRLYRVRCRLRAALAGSNIFEGQE